MLFADLVGFTTLAEHRDPESVKRLVDECFALLVDDVAAFGGNVDKVLGDGIVALFGAPVAHEDDAERAVRAGLKMQRTLDRFAAVQGQADVRMRIGINTGEVLTGAVVGADYTAMGDAVNTAARLQAQAAPGEVVVGDSTYALTSHTIRYKSSGEVQLRGRSQPVTAWTALEATAPPGRRRGRRDVGLVGRSSEMALASAALGVALRDRHSVIVTITGDSGVGKSRLVDELLEHLPDDVSVLRGACVPYGESNAWWPIASALTSYLDVDPAAALHELRATAGERARQLGSHLGPDDVDELVDAFTHLLGLPSPLDRLDPSALRSTVHRSVHQVVSLRAHERPFVLALSDMQWADPAVIDLLDHLATSLHRLPFALLTTLRPGTDVLWPPRHDRVTSAVVHLHPLTADETARLATALLAEEEPSEQLLAALFERSGGNPLFLEELAAMADGGRPLSQLPDSLRALIGARLDELTNDQRNVLDNAATLGTSGTLGALERFAEAMQQEFDPVTVDDLEDLGLLERRGRRWSFRSNSVRDTAYRTLTKANRAARHAGVAKALSPATPATLDDLAHHLATSAELTAELGLVPGVPADVAEAAVEALLSAAQRAADSGIARLAIRHATRALNLLPVGDTTHVERRVQLLLARAGQYVELRAFNDARRDIDQVLSLTDERHNRAAHGEAKVRLGQLLQMEGRLSEARAELDQAVVSLRGGGHQLELANALRTRGFIELFGGSLGEAEGFLDEADELYNELSNERGLALVEQHRAWISFLAGDLVTAKRRLTDAADTLDRLGDRNGVGWAFGLSAFVEYFERNFDAAEAIARTVVAEADQRGDEWASTMMQVLLADLRLWSGKLDEALALAERARTHFRKIGDLFGAMQASAPLLRAQVALGRHDAAQRTAEELLAQSETGMLGPYPMLAVAGAAMHRGDGVTALRLTSEATEQFQSHGTSTVEIEVIRAVAFAQTGKAEEAAIVLDGVDAGASEHPFTLTANALVAALLGDHAAALGYAERAIAARGCTYLDEVIARVAAAGVHHAQSAPELTARELDAAVTRARQVGDVVAVGLAAAAYERALRTRPGEVTEHAELSDGWRSVVESLFSE